MKRLLVSVLWTAWEWITWPQRRWLFSSYGAQLSIRDSVKCRRLIESPWYRARWGHIFSLTSDQNAKTRFDNNRSGYRLSTSVGGSVTGAGGDRILCDDPHKVAEVESDTARRKSPISRSAPAAMPLPASSSNGRRPRAAESSSVTGSDISSREAPISRLS